MAQARQSLRSLTPKLPLILVCLALSASTPASAEPRPECRCRAEGQTYALGSVVVLRAPGGATRCVRCVMSANVTSWETVEAGCPLARRSTPAAEVQRATRQSL